jgi:putative ABC transport system permease protein
VVDMSERSVLERLYRFVLRLMPAENRHRYGDEVSQALAAIVRTERPASPLARLRWASLLLLRGAIAALGMHYDRWRRRSARPWRGAEGGLRASFWNDFRYVLRGLRGAPWYSTTVMAVVAAPIAMAATTFAVVDGVLFRPLPYPDAAQLVALLPNFEGPSRTTIADGSQAASELDLRHWRAVVPHVPITAYRVQPWSGLGENINDAAAGVAVVEANFFDVVRVWPLFGGFTADDFRAPNRIQPVITTYNVWQGRFAGGEILGREIVTNRATGSGVRIVGVMPKGFAFPSTRWDVSFLAPYVSTGPPDPRRRYFSEVIARLPEGTTAASVEERLRPGAAAVAREFPALGLPPQGWPEARWRRQGPYDLVEVRPLSKTLAAKNVAFFSAVFGAVILLIVMAAVNISSLMAARALDRQPQMDVRRSLGATARAIARLWLLESSVLVMSGGALALATMPYLLRVMTHLLPENLVLLKPAAFDWRVSAFIATSLLVLSFVIAVAPIRKALGSGWTRSASPRVRTSSRFLIVGGQVAVAVVLTVLGSMLVGSLLLVYAEDPPIHVDDVVALNVMLAGPGATMSPSPERAAREQSMRERLKGIAGVRAVGSSGAQVLAGGGALFTFRPPSGRRPPGNLDTWAVSEGFYDVLEPQIVAGRVPSNDELRQAAPLAVVSERVAKAYWPDGGVIGQNLTNGDTNTPFTVVGVVREVRWTAWDTESPVIYAPYATTSRAPWITFLLRTDGQTGRVAADAVRVIQAADALATPRRAGTLDEWFRESVMLRRLQSWLFGSFAAAALVIVGAGILGLLAMSAARRTKEVGIRCALGATRLGVVVMMLREQLAAVLAGVIAGGAAAAWAIQPLKSYLYQVTPADPRVWVTAIAVVLMVAVAGTLVPALKASQIDPVRALRQD